MNLVTVELPQDVLDAARTTVPELKLGIAVPLYAQGWLAIGKASELEWTSGSFVMCWQQDASPYIWNQTIFSV